MIRNVFWMCALILVGTAASGCASKQEVKQPTGDAIKDLKVAVSYAEHALPVLKLACSQVEEAKRGSCSSLISKIEEIVPKAKEIIASAEACTQEDDDVQCIATAIDAANVLLSQLQSIGSAP